MKEKIMREYPYKTEMHAHTLPVSRCSQVEAEKLVELYKAQGVDTVVLTNHFLASEFGNRTKDEAVAFYMQAYRDLYRCAQENGMQAVLGVEIRFAEDPNDYLVYGVEEADIPVMYDYLYKDIDTFYKAFKNERNVILQAHPFRNGQHRVERSCVDGIETYNLHPNHNSRVALGVAYARAQGMLISGGTDFHEPGHEALCLIRTRERMENSFQVAQMLKSRDFVFEVRGNIILP